MVQPRTKDQGPFLEFHYGSSGSRCLQYFVNFAFILLIVFQNVLQFSEIVMRVAIQNYKCIFQKCVGIVLECFAFFGESLKIVEFNLLL